MKKKELNKINRFIMQKPLFFKMIYKPNPDGFLNSTLNQEAHFSILQNIVLKSITCNSKT